MLRVSKWTILGEDKFFSYLYILRVADRKEVELFVVKKPSQRSDVKIDSNN